MGKNKIKRFYITIYRKDHPFHTLKLKCTKGQAEKFIKTLKKTYEIVEIAGIIHRKKKAK